MDLENFKPKTDDVEVILTVYIRNENGIIETETLTNKDGSEMSITLHNPNTKEYRKAKQKALKMARNAKGDVSPETLDSYRIASATKNWNITLKGEKPKFSEELAFEVYEDYNWIKALIDSELSENLVFTRN